MPILVIPDPRRYSIVRWLKWLTSRSCLPPVRWELAPGGRSAPESPQRSSTPEGHCSSPEVVEEAEVEEASPVEVEEQWWTTAGPVSIVRQPTKTDAWSDWAPKRFSLPVYIANKSPIPRT